MQCFLGENGPLKWKKLPSFQSRFSWKETFDVENLHLLYIEKNAENESI